MSSAEVRQFPQPDDPQNEQSNSKVGSLRIEPSSNLWDVGDRSRQSYTLQNTASRAVPEPDPLLTVEEVAQRLRVTRDWVWDHSSRKAPFLPVIRVGDGTLRYRASSVEEFIDQRERLTHLRRKRA
jgi:predicted DNA-binding transcriptional regulator AlpA